MAILALIFLVYGVVVFLLFITDIDERNPIGTAGQKVLWPIAATSWLVREGVPFLRTALRESIYGREG